MAKFHINPETKEIGKCTASIQECRYGAVPHFDNIQEAYQQSEKMLEEEYGNFNKVEKESANVDDFSQKIPAGASLSIYVDKGDQIKYNDNIYTVKDFHYERALLGYIIDTEEEGEIKVDDYDWYHSSKISVLEDKQKNAQFKSAYYSSDEFNIPLEENTNLAQLDYDLDQGMTIKLDNDLLTIEDYYSSNDDEGESFMVIKTKEYGPIEIREKDISNIRTYGGKPEASTPEIDYNEPQTEDFSTTISKSHRKWRSPEEYFNEEDYINYHGKTQKIEKIESSLNNYGEYNYTIITNKDTITISDHEWKESDELDISIVKDSPNADLLNEFPPGHTGAVLSDYVSPGDWIEYNGEEYKVNDFEYNRALLSYELNTDAGTIYIHDDDWYHDSKIKIIK